MVGRRQFDLLLVFPRAVLRGRPHLVPRVVWEATAHTVPFLYRALEADGTPDKQAFVHLVATIADCETGAAGHMAASQRAVGERLNLLYSYPRDPNPEISRAVAWAVGPYPEAVARLRPDLEAALRDEPDEYARGALREAIARRSSAPLTATPTASSIGVRRTRGSGHMTHRVGLRRGA